jgi:hypothetical protein
MKKESEDVRTAASILPVETSITQLLLRTNKNKMHIKPVLPGDNTVSQT